MYIYLYPHKLHKYNPNLCNTQTRKFVGSWENNPKSFSFSRFWPFLSKFSCVNLTNNIQSSEFIVVNFPKFANRNLIVHYFIKFFSPIGDNTICSRVYRSTVSGFFRMNWTSTLFCHIFLVCSWGGHTIYYF